MLLQDLHDYELINYQLVLDLKWQVYSLNKRVEALELSNIVYKSSVVHVAHTSSPNEPQRLLGSHDSDYHRNKQVDEEECLPTSLPPPP